MTDRQWRIFTWCIIALFPLGIATISILLVRIVAGCAA